MPISKSNSAKQTSGFRRSEPYPRVSPRADRGQTPKETQRNTNWRPDISQIQTETESQRGAQTDQIIGGIKSWAGA